MPVLIEDHSENSLTWGVSLTSSNPLPQDFIECWSKTEAVALLQFVESLPPEGTKLVRETLPKYRVFFVLQEKKLAEYQPIIERSEKLSDAEFRPPGVTHSAPLGRRSFLQIPPPLRVVS